MESGGLPLRLLIASHNEGKVREFRRLLADAGTVAGAVAGADVAAANAAYETASAAGAAGSRAWELLSLTDLALLWRSETLGGLPPVAGDGEQAEQVIAERYACLLDCMEETGTTFEENATIKALGAASFTGLLTLADDSGLEVDWLGGAPGVYSARYAGPEGDEKACRDLLLLQMRDAPEGKRTARYRVALVLAGSEKVLHITEGVCEGDIGFTPAGSGGFGYDPIFLPAGDTRTMAQLTMEEKNKISHRGKALAQMRDFLTTLPRRSLS